MGKNNTVSDDDRIIDEYIKVVNEIFFKSVEVEEPLINMVASEIGFEILDLKFSINALLDKKCYAGIQTIARTMLENYINLVYILSGDSHRRSKAYQLANYKDMRKQVNMQKNNKELQKIIKTDKSLNESIEWHDKNKEEVDSYLKELDKLYGHILNPWYNDDNCTKNISLLFKRVGKSHLYDTLYRFLCLEAHGNNGFKHFSLVDDQHATLNRTTLSEDKIDNITNALLKDTRKELEKLII